MDNPLITRSSRPTNSKLYVAEIYFFAYNYDSLWNRGKLGGMGRRCRCGHRIHLLISAFSPLGFSFLPAFISAIIRLHLILAGFVLAPRHEKAPRFSPRCFFRSAVC